MKNILEAPFIIETIRTTANMYALGWDERNSGNISLLLDETEVREYLDITNVLRVLPTGFSTESLAGKYFLVTATGSYFRNVQFDPAANLGIVRISEDGCSAELLWGFEGGGRFTSEFPTHMMSHAVRLAADPENRVIMHCHPNDLIAMTHVHELDERAFTRTLWKMCTESIMVFPDGVGLLPWMPCGTVEIGEATAEKMSRSRLIIWALHGIYGAGRTLDEACGLIETADKAANVYLKIAHFPVHNSITDPMLRKLASGLGLNVREGYLEE